MKDKIIWLGFILISLALFIYFLFSAPVQLAGDIAEYYGITQSLINHQGFNLTPQDQIDLEKVLHKAYFSDPTYYIQGIEGKRYPVHFVFYSILALPVRIILSLFSINPLKSLSITNLSIFLATNLVILKNFIKSTSKRIIYLILIFLSPLVFFISWPGVDIFYICMLMLAVFSFYNKKYPMSVIFASLASWHSQPLIIVWFDFLAYLTFKKRKVNWYLAVSSFFLVCLPYLYNYLAFEVLTPWTIFREGWTERFGFGLQNASFKKFFELFFDLNMGFFWYAPFIFIFGAYSFFKTSKKRKILIFTLLLLITTAFFYQTNPAWHYGTAGYGPSRHSLYLLPFLIYFIVEEFKKTSRTTVFIILLIITQSYILYFNSFLSPKFQKTLYHSPYARFVLNNAPFLYNPTPEIFVDRTAHTDKKYISSAVYKYGSECKKAYILKGEEDLLMKVCGSLSKEQLKYDKFGGAYIDY